MNIRTSLALTAVLAALAGCSTPPATIDVPGTVDVQPGTDVPPTGTDVPPTGTDAGRDVPTGTDVQGTDTAMMGNFGSCGASVHTCLCGCGAMDQACQQGCLSADRSCLQCVVDAQGQCCPTENNAVNDCAAAAQMASDAGPACTDEPCIRTRCATQITTLQTCLRAQAMVPACQGYLSVCVGDGRCP